jgi:site-specific DNA-cytosine methylase
MEDTQSEIRYANIIPLIGGMALGAQRATGKKPEFILSYPAFKGNDHILTDYWDDVPYHVIDPESNTIDMSLPRVDFVGALCPCAGLSQLNSAKSRGANAPQNEWLYKSTEFVLENMSPKVLWGENAPALYGSVGLPVAEKLRVIGEKYSYSMSLLRTDSTLHGIPQKRVRAFYFLWKSPNAPIMGWYKRETPTLGEHLATIRGLLDPAEVEEKTVALQKDPLYNWLKKVHGEGWRAEVRRCTKSLMDVVLMSGRIEEYLDFVQKGEYSEEAYNRAAHARHKREISKNFWDFSPFLPGDATGALTGARMNAIHPTEDRLMTYRELSHLMGIPLDMAIPNDAPGKIFQNVPSGTSADWTREVVKFCKGELPFSEQKFLKQDNVIQRTETAEVKREVQVLF